MYNILMKKILFLLLALFALTACGRIVTDKTVTDNSGQAITVREAEFIFTFAADPAVNGNYKYYLIITTSNVTDGLLNGSDSVLDYFASPDDTAASQNQRFIDQYYERYTDYDDMQKVYRDYFTKWYEYFMFDRTSGLRVYTDINGFAGPYVWTNPLTQYFTRQITMRNSFYPAANQLRLTIPCPPYSTFYLGLVTVDDTNGQRYIADGLGLVPVNTQTNGTVINDQPDYTADAHISGRAGLDIVSYTVKITEY